MTIDPDAAGPSISRAQTPAELASARELMREYAERLAVDLCFQQFDVELERLGEMYGPPGGVLLIARLGAIPVGCVGLRALSAELCEMKRLYIRAAARGGGLGRRLATTVIAQARELGYRRMVLDTLAPMHEARSLYAALGFRECLPYYDNPLPGAIYMALDLATAVAPAR
ncbi:MAG TPA: GNAT family N-acetyltransferase [Steroidobacteraceae bacterium]|nr:GNAT family N-acetyltransferase [Steroidobacteraceae bacterium]